MPAKPRDADAPEPVSSEESADSRTSGVALREKSIAAIRRLYAKGDVDGAMALATKHAHATEQLSPPAHDWTDASVSIHIGPEVEIDVDVSLTGLTSYVESAAIDVSLSGLEHQHGADAPDASVHVWVEAEAVDVSLTGLESFEHPADRSLPGLSGIIDDIESLEPTLGFGRRSSRRELLAQQKLFAQDLGPGVMPHITMPPPAESVPEVLTSEVPFPSAPGMRPRALELSEGERRSIPRILRSPSEIATLPLGPRGGFILAQMDGKQTVEEILDVCAMPMAEAIEIIRRLESLGVIRLE